MKRFLLDDCKSRMIVKEKIREGGGRVGRDEGHRVIIALLIWTHLCVCMLELNLWCCYLTSPLLSSSRANGSTIEPCRPTILAVFVLVVVKESSGGRSWWQVWRCWRGGVEHASERAEARMSGGAPPVAAAPASAVYCFVFIAGAEGGGSVVSVASWIV